MVAWRPGPRWLAGLFVLSLLLPSETSFLVGGLRLSPYRVVILLSLWPAVAAMLRSRRSIVDVLFLLAGAWAMLASVVNGEARGGLQSGGIHAIELVGGYLLGRWLAGGESSCRWIFRAVCTATCAIALPAVAECLSHRHGIKELFAAMRGESFDSWVEPRFGLSRAFGPFDHPILLGTFAASAVGLAWWGLSDARSPKAGRVCLTLGCLVTAMASLSSGAFAAIGVQILVGGWRRLSGAIARRWLILAGLLVGLYAGVGLVSNRSGLRVALSYLTFSPGTAEARVTIWEWGFWENAIRHPAFGIGEGDWVRPSWMYSASMDNFWLVEMVTFGMPAFGALAAAAVLSLLRGGRQHLPEAASRLRFGWSASLLSLIVSACTVHFWNQSLVYLAFLIGVGQWLSVLSQPPKSALRSRNARQIGRSIRREG